MNSYILKINPMLFVSKWHFGNIRHLSILQTGANLYNSSYICLAYHPSKIRKKTVMHEGKLKLSERKFSIFHKIAVKRCNLLPTHIAMRGLKKTTNDSEEKEKDSLSYLFHPVTYEVPEFEEKVGEDIVGPLKKDEIVSVITRFYTDEEIKELAAEHGLDKYLFQKTTISFRKFCIDSEQLPTDLHILISDILKGACHIHDLYPYFYKHAKNIFPHLNCMEDLYKVSDLTQPPNWFPEARVMIRKIIFHAGPTNSGKTYHAMEQFLTAKSGIYCGPLKLLAVEVCQKSNDRGTPCDLMTGEERRYAVSEDFPSTHVACTVEMASVNTKYDVAIVDEIQMLRDPSRGWAWTRALLGLNANEIHVCGEPSAIELIKDLALSVGEDVEVRRYKRLTPLLVEETALMSLDLVRPGDCIVCFSMQQVHSAAQSIERLGHEVAIIYGRLPPGAKLGQAKKFNDPSHPCKILVATDAIGMGLNLSIRRIVFATLMKPHVNEKGEKEMDTISVSAALQIGGRAGRYGTEFSEGFVTTLKPQDLPVLRKLMSMTPEDIEQAGLTPTAEQIELFAYHLPNYSLSNLIDIFVRLCTVDTSSYFMCIMSDFKFLADLIQHVALPLRTRYVFCCAPINKKMPFVCAHFLKFARQCSQNEPITLEWLCTQVKWPFTVPKTISELEHLEEVFDVFDLYLWLSYRFTDMFPDMEMVRSLQRELDDVIQSGVSHITQLLRNSEPAIPAGQRVNGKQSDLKPRNKGVVDISSTTDPKDKAMLKKLSQEYRVSKQGMSHSLTQRLLSKGILSPKMIEELKIEWRQEDSKMNNDKNVEKTARRKPKIIKSVRNRRKK